jgi:hypothetical protein
VSHFCKGFVQIVSPCRTRARCCETPAAPSLQQRPNKGNLAKERPKMRKTFTGVSVTVTCHRAGAAAPGVCHAPCPPAVRRALRLRRDGASAAPAPEAVRWASKRTQSGSAI